MIYFVAYDITDKKRLPKVSKILSNYGIRIQFSFFECELKKSQMEQLKKDLLAIIDKKKDSLNIYPLCTDCVKQVQSIGTGALFIPQSFEIL